MLFSFLVKFRRSQVQRQMDEAIAAIILLEAAALIKPDGVVPADIRFQHQPHKAALAGNTHQAGHQRLGNALSAQIAGNRHAHDAPGLRVLADERARSDQRPVEGGYKKRLAGRDVVRRYIIDVWIARFINDAEMLAQASENQAARGVLICGDKGANGQCCLLHRNSISGAAIADRHTPLGILQGNIGIDGSAHSLDRWASRPQLRSGMRSQVELAERFSRLTGCGI